MAITGVRTMTVEEYLAFEEQSELQYEFIDGELYEMPGGTFQHENINVNLAHAFRKLLDRSAFTVLGSRMQVRIPPTKIVYPDLSVVRGQQQTEHRQLILLNPTLVVEVLSSSSVIYDQIEKRGWYLAVPSIQHCLIIDQFSVDVELLTRAGDDWHSQRFIEMADVIRIDALDCDLPLADVYDRIELE